MAAHATKDFFVIISCLLIASPGVNCVDECFRGKFLGCFAKGKERDPVMGPEFNHCFWLKSGY
jgi:hypothetical protein